MSNKVTLSPKLRQSILDRDNYTCQNPLCPTIGRKMSTDIFELHHCLTESSHPQFALEEWNLTLLCYRCHRDAHKTQSIMYALEIEAYTRKYLLDQKKAKGKEFCYKKEYKKAKKIIKKIQESYVDSKLLQEILHKKPEGYLLHGNDTQWIKTASTYWNGKSDNTSILQAFKEAAAHEEHYDPFEIPIDFCICTPELQPL